MRLIDADEAVKAVHDEFDECLVWDESGETTANEFENIILQIPTVDPVKHGHWKEHKDYPGLAYLCSGCGYFTTDRSYYCPHCGAKMEDANE